LNGGQGRAFGGRRAEKVESTEGRRGEREEEQCFWLLGMSWPEDKKAKKEMSKGRRRRGNMTARG
jgi:hypothetical protein